MLIDDLFKDEDDITVEGPENSTGEQTGEEKDETNPVITTKAVSERINEVRRKTQTETRDSVAKELGFNSYTEMMANKSKQQETEIIKEAGLDEEAVAKTVEQLVNKRLAEDPRMKKLEEFETQQRADFVSKQLKEINELTGNTFTEIGQLPPDTLKMWELTGDLKKSYLATQGEGMIRQIKESAKRGSTTHLAEGGNANNIKVRPLTEEEKAMYRWVNPNISEEELNKKTVEDK